MMIPTELFENIILHSISVFGVNDGSILEHLDILESELGSFLCYLYSLLLRFLCLFHSQYFCLCFLLIDPCLMLFVPFLASSDICLPFFRGLSEHTLNRLLFEVWISPPVGHVIGSSQCLPIQLFQDFLGFVLIVIVIWVLLHHYFE